MINTLTVAEHIMISDSLVIAQQQLVIGAGLSIFSYQIKKVENIITARFERSNTVIKTFNKWEKRKIDSAYIKFICALHEEYEKVCDYEYLQSNGNIYDTFESRYLSLDYIEQNKNILCGYN